MVNNSPYVHKPTLAVTHNGGKDWEVEDLPIPESFENSNRIGQFPIFFTKSVGVIPIVGIQEDKSVSLLYMLTTNNSGQTWQAVTTNHDGELRWSFDNQSLTFRYKDQKVTYPIRW